MNLYTAHKSKKSPGAYCFPGGVRPSVRPCVRTFVSKTLLVRRISRDVNKATDSKAEAEAEANVPWHKLVIMHNFFKTFLQYFKPFSFRCFRLIL